MIFNDIHEMTFRKVTENKVRQLQRAGIAPKRNIERETSLSLCPRSSEGGSAQQGTQVQGQGSQVRGGRTPPAGPGFQNHGAGTATSTDWFWPIVLLSINALGLYE